MVVMFWSIVTEKAVVTYAAAWIIWNKGHGGKGLRVDQGRVTSLTLVELRR